MKKTLFVLWIAASLAACKTSDKELSTEEKVKAGKDVANYTTLQWLDSVNTDLGKINEGQVVEVSYRFKNTGSKNLIIEDVRASCGCTVPEKPEKPFAPGEEGVIKAKFDSKDRKGMQNKTVTVIANTNPQKEYYLTFKVEVTN